VVHLRYFAKIRETLGSDGEKIEFNEHCQDVKSLLELLKSRGEPWADLLETSIPVQVLVAVNRVVIKNNQTLCDGDEVAFFPPVTGG